MIDVGSENSVLGPIRNTYVEGAVPRLGEETPFSEYTVRLRGEDERKEHVGEVTTIMDRVYEFINKKGSTSVKELTERLGIKKEQAESMIEMLESTGLVRLKYSVVPNGNVEVLVLDREYLTPVNRMSHAESVDLLKKAVVEDMEKLEHSLSSIEQHIRMWSSDAEENIRAKAAPETEINSVTQESMRIERSLEEFSKRTAQKIQDIKKALSDLRVSVNAPSGRPVGDGRKKKGLFGTGLFNF